jgi:hypothetical protein
LCCGQFHSIWHATHIDWVDLQHGKNLKSNVYTATLVKNTIGGMSRADDLVITSARSPWELHYYDAETSLYKRIEGQGINPKFLDT